MNTNKNVYRNVMALALCAITLFAHTTPSHAGIRLKELGRVDGVRDNAVIGYGLVVGLAGTGDTSRSKATMQSIMNTLSQFGTQVPLGDINSRNVAAVMITATLPAFSERGDRVDVNVSSLGDARSLVGGTLLLAPLKAANDKIYALAQGPISVGGYKYDLNGNVVQKNHPTVGKVPLGATIEKRLKSTLLDGSRNVHFILHDPDFTTVTRLKYAINARYGVSIASPVHAGRIAVKVPFESGDIIEFITDLENIEINPDKIARVIINERTGTVVAGGDVRIDNVTISHGDIKVVITTDFDVSQPLLVSRTGANVSTAVVPNTRINVEETPAKAVDLSSGATIGELVTALRQIKTTTRDVIVILQAIRKAGALHAQLVIQ